VQEMSYETWCKRAKYLTARCDMYNEWRIKSKMRLLTDIAPRIGKLSTQFYMGCGFHYDLEQQLAKLISGFAISEQFCANWCAKIPDKLAVMEVRRVLMQSLVKQVVDAEKSVIQKMD
jgi:hypothetical protein